MKMMWSRSARRPPNPPRPQRTTLLPKDLRRAVGRSMPCFNQAARRGSRSCLMFEFASNMFRGLFTDWFSLTGLPSMSASDVSRGQSHRRRPTPHEPVPKFRLTPALWLRRLENRTHSLTKTAGECGGQGILDIAAGARWFSLPTLPPFHLTNRYRPTPQSRALPGRCSCSSNSLRRGKATSSRA